MENSGNQTDRKQGAEENLLKTRGRPRTSPIDEYAGCQSPVCNFIAQNRIKKWRVFYADCCLTLLTARTKASLSHPESSTTNLQTLFEQNSINSHDEFHRFIAKEGLELTVNLKHQNVSFLIPQHEVQIDQPTLQEHHHIEKETQTTTPEQMVPKSLFDEERYMRMDYERKLQSVFELLTQWERSGDIGKSCFAQEMRSTLASKR